MSDRLRNTVRTNQQYVSPGANFMLLNGMLVEVKNFEIYSECLSPEAGSDCALKTLLLSAKMQKHLSDSRAISQSWDSMIQQWQHQHTSNTLVACAGHKLTQCHWCAACAGFLDRLRIELRLQGQLQGLGFKPGLVQQLLKQRATSNAEVNELRLDLSPMKQVGHQYRADNHVVLACGSSNWAAC